MTAQIRVAPSLLAADFARLGDEIRLMEKSGADWLHLDIMDGHFVPNITFGPPLVASVNKITSLFLDAHLMITDPDRYVEAFASAGADLITVHAEACDHLQETLGLIHRRGCKAGVSLKPATPFSILEPHLAFLDLILFMTVEPGFSGQALMPGVLPKIREAKAYLDERAMPVWLEADGGIGTENAAEVVAAGATVLVAGAAIFGKPNPGEIIRRMKMQ